MPTLVHGQHNMAWWRGTKNGPRVANLVTNSLRKGTLLDIVIKLCTQALVSIFTQVSNWDTNSPNLEIAVKMLTRAWVG